MFYINSFDYCFYNPIGIFNYVKIFLNITYFNPLIFDFSNKNSGLDFNIFSRAVSTISVFKSSRTTGMFAHCNGLQSHCHGSRPIITTLLIFHKMVEATGFEPATLWSQTRCATDCATPPTSHNFIIYIV